MRSVVSVALVMMGLSAARGCGPVRRAASVVIGRTVKTVHVKVGKATITDVRSGTSHIRIECKNGLVINADWRRNVSNEFGYDIHKPSENKDDNRLAVMMTARGIIAAYLRGEYD